MRVALVHDWLTGLRGGEKCLQAFLRLYPNADIFTLVHRANVTDPIIDSRVQGTSFLQKLPGVHNYYRMLLPLYPVATRSLVIEGYDLVISLSHAAAKNVKVPESSVHICYCFTPMRYVWDQTPHYFGMVTPALWPLISSLRNWDRNGAKSVDGFVAISTFVAARIRKFYGRKAEVIYPPVDTSWIPQAHSGEHGRAYLYAGALVPYKYPQVAAEACSRLGRKLWVVGKGPLLHALKKYDSRDVKVLGALSNPRLAWCYQNCRALLFPGKEDFGMIPVECMAAGRPVIGQAAGGLKDTVRGIPSWSFDGNARLRDVTGVFFKADPTTKDLVEGMIEAIECFEQVEDLVSTDACRVQAEKFSPVVFYEAWAKYITNFGFEAPDIPPQEDREAKVLAAEVAA